MSRLLEKVAAFTNLVEDGFDVNDASILVKLAEEEDEDNRRGRDSRRLVHAGAGAGVGAVGGGALGTLAGYRKGRKKSKDSVDFIRRNRDIFRKQKFAPGEIRKVLKENTSALTKRLGAAGFLAGSLGGAVAGASLPVRDREKAAAFANLLDNGYDFDDAVAIIGSLS